MNESVKLGKYRHYKGSLNEVIDTALHSETQEPLVIYRHYEGDTYTLWARPLAMFLENVMVNGRAVPRFEYLGD